MESERTTRIKALDYDYGAQTKEIIERCNLCSGNYFVQIEHVDRYGYSVGSFACGTCGLVFLNPRMIAQEYGEFYSTVYRPLVSAYHGRLVDAKSIQQEQNIYAIERAEFLAPYMKGRPKDSLLDIGGSTGVVAMHFVERFGFTGKVLDPSAEELSEAASLGLETVQGFFEDLDFGREKFDLILLCQTIDHLLDIDAALEKVHSCLSKDGMFFVDIVDFRAAYLRHGKVSEAIKIDHPYYLTQESIETFLRRKGFVILRKGYAADHLHVNYVCGLGRARVDYLPTPKSVERLLYEIRTVQNTPRNIGTLA